MLAASIWGAGAKEKVILDTDMVMLYDDGVAMMMLAGHPNIDLLGVTIVPGNTWISEGTAYAIRQLERINRTDVPVAMGTRYPLRAGRYETIQLEQKMFGSGSSFTGCFARTEPESYLDVCEKYRFDKRLFDRITAAKTPIALMFEERYGPAFRKDPHFTRLVWDTVAAAVVIDPTLIVEEQSRWVDVDSNYGLDYGRSLGFLKRGPAGTRQARILMTINEERFWELTVRLLTK